MRNNGQGFMNDDHAQDAFSQVLPTPPSCIPLLPSDSLNRARMAIVKDKTQFFGSNCSWSHVFQTDLGNADGYTKNAGHMLIKVDDYAQQGFHHLEIFCDAMSIALSYTIYGMLTALPFDRGKMVSSLLTANFTKVFSSKPCAPSTSIKSIGRRLLL